MNVSRIPLLRRPLPNISPALGAAALGHLTLELCNNYLPAIYPVLATTLGLTYTQIGTLSMLSSVSGTFPQPLLGYLIDRQDSRFWGAFSLIWIGIVMGLVGFTHSYTALAIMVMLGSLASATFHPVGVATVSSVASHTHRGTAMSVFSVGGNIGAAFSPLLITAMMAVMGPRGTAILIPIGVGMGLWLFRWLPRGGVDADEAARRRALARTGRIAGLLTAMLITMMHAYFYRGFTTYLPLLYQSRGAALAAGSTSLSVLLFSLGIGSITGGMLADRIGRWQTDLIAFLSLPIVLITFLHAPGWALLPLVAIFGVLSGIPFPINLVMGNESWPHMPAVASGLVLGTGWLVGGLGAWATGFLADRLGLVTALSLLVVPALLAALSALAYSKLGAPHVK
ncbi:MAG: MFS transporter [Anaerolineae bacterium]|nr:MFS transporter [Anaerolineae bacterium]